MADTSPAFNATQDANAFTDLLTKVDALRAANPIPGAPVISKPIIIPIPIHLPQTTTVLRGTTTIGYIFTPGGDPAPTGAGVTLTGGILWVQASLLGAAFSGVPGFAGVPFSGATLETTGSVTFSAGKITLDPAATLALDVTSSVTPATGAAGDPIGPDFLAAKLTPFSGATVAFGTAGATIALAGTGAATIYGQNVTLTPAASPTPVDLNFTTPHVAIPCTAGQKTFTVSKSTSPEIVLAGTAPIVGASVVFPIYDAAPASLPQPADAWGIAIGTGPGLSATIAPLTAALALAGAAFALTPARLVGLVANGANRARETYLLWPSTPPASPLPPSQPQLALPQSQITVDLAPAALVAFSADPTVEITIVSGALTATLDRPLDASGQRLPLAGPALVTRTHTATSLAVEVGSTLTPGAAPLALIAENALVPVGTPDGFVLAGTLTGNVIDGGLAIVFPGSAVIPTFPDPYAAVYGATADEQKIGSTLAAVAWTPTTAPVVTVTMNSAAAAAGTVAAATEGVALFADESSPDTLIALDRLLDVSTNADQWGIAFAPRGNALSFSGLVLQAPAAQTAVFTVPGISWEPVVEAGSAPAWLAASSPDDGTPTLFLVAVDTPAAIIPATTLQQYQKAAGSEQTRAEFTLPFGITAQLNDTRSASTQAGPTYTIPSIVFPAQGLTGARVLSITGAPSAQPLESTLPGTAVCGYNATSPAYGQQVLDGVPPVGPSVASFWDQDFGPGGKGYMPVSRIDLSGYGTSMFSDWHDPSLTDVGVVRALFNVLLGRTGHEIITAQTWILPWCIRLQRTITFDRSDGGDVVRHDTGWHAVAAGEFEFLQGSPTIKSRILLGPVTSLNNVRNIQFSTGTVTVGSLTYTPCTFDADVAFTPTLNMSADGKSSVSTVVCTSIRGYADDTASINTATTLSADDIIALMQQVGRATGTTGCVARTHGSGTGQFAMAVTAIGAAVAAGSTPMLQTALFGTPQLPKDGQWSIAKRPSGATAPVPVAAHAPVPLTQGTSAGSTVPSSPGTFAANCFRLLDPEDAQSVDSPQNFYSVLQGTGTSKSLFEHPLINDLGNGLGFGNVPGLADAGALLGIAGVFPDIGNVLQIPANQGGLPINADGFVKTYDLGAAATPAQPQPPDRSLLDIGIVHLVMSYQAGGNPFTGQVVLDATPGAPNWSISLSNLSFEASVDGLGSDPLLTVTGGFQAGASTKPGFTNLQVDYGSALNAVKSLLSGLSDLASSLGGSAELDVGFTGNTLTVQEGFTLPTIPLGFGEIQDLGLDLGFTATIPSSLGFSVGIGSQQDPFQWVVSPLAGTGAIVLGVQDGGPNVYIEASLGLGLSLSVAVASGSASIEVGLALDVGTNEISISASLTGNAQVDVLGGLASASLTLSASITVTVEQSPHQADLSAQCSVGIHISICWVISISFDGSWGFSETIALS